MILLSSLYALVGLAVAVAGDQMARRPEESPARRGAIAVLVMILWPLVVFFALRRMWRSR